ncbi:MAG TPA: hypothetical protein VF550_05350 [Polyangia bacterium]
MRAIFRVTAFIFVLGGIIGCNLRPSGPGTASSSGGAGQGSGGAIPSASGGAGGGSSVGLPCDIQAILIKDCASCHGAKVSGGAPRSLVTYADLTRIDIFNSGITEAQAALQRMQSKTAPMPPGPSSSAPTSADIGLFQTWISNGYPSGTCGVTPTGTGGTTPSASGGTLATGGNSPSSTGGAGGSGAGNPTMPCAVQALLANRCISCHGSPPSGGAPRALVTFADLTLMDPASPGQTEAQVALARMQNKAAPMPPLPAAPATAAEIAAMQSWVGSGLPSVTCGTGSGGVGGSTAMGTGGNAGGGGAGGSTGTGGSGGTNDAGVTNGNLPCNLQTLVNTRCASCHGNTLAGGAPRSLVTYAQLTLADPANPSLTEAQAALQRMQNTASPMPPAPAAPATAAEIAIVQNWINGGYPSGACTGDAGVPTNDPLNANPTCTSKTTWNGGTNGSSSMEPGQACISCHARSGGEAPTFVIAGTLYPTGHEPDNCNGANGNNGAKVFVTGKNGTIITLTPNSVGNFSSSTTLPPPYMAKVVSSSGVERVMSSTASTGDCNSCHTQSGTNSAPGRITMP